MKEIFGALDIRTLIKQGEGKPTLILICASLLVALHRTFGSIDFARGHLQFDELQAALFQFATAFVVLGLVPLAIIIFLFKEKPGDYGLKSGNWRLGVSINLWLLPVIALLLLYPSSHTPEMLAYYPFAKSAGNSVGDFLMLEVPRVVLFYTAWEFFFRGFMLFGLRPYLGPWLAICVQTIPSCLWHIGVPTGELLSSIAGGILFGVMAIRTNSIVWPFIMHCLIGIVLDLFIVAGW